MIPKGERLFNYCQSLLGLALFDIKNQEFRSALQKINTIESLKKELPWETHHHEFYFIPLIRALCSKRRESHLLLELRKIPRNHPYRYFFQLCFPQIDSSEFSELNLSSAQREYVQKMLFILGVDAYRRIRVTTATSQSVIPKAEMKPIQKGEYDLIIDQTQRSLKVNDQKKKVEEKTVLLELLGILIQNAGKHLSKEELTALVWKERYNPLVHDTRIYSAIRRLRALLGPLKKFIVTGAGTYQMNSGLNFCLMEPIDRRSDLTDKQNWILSYAEKNGTIDRKTVQETLRIGSTSSKSELNRLVEIGLLRKKGDGRSTSYHTL